MTKKQDIRRGDGVVTRTGSLHHKVLVLASILICYQAEIDAFGPGLGFGRCATSTSTSASGRTLALRRFFFQGPTSTHPFPTTSGNESSLQGVFGGFFGGDTAKDDEQDGVLATYDIKLSGATDVNVKYESLSDFITNKWANLFVNGTIKLTTPVRVTKSESNTCQLIFEKVQTGYQSKKEEGDRPVAGDGESKKKKKEKKQGGVEISILPPSADTKPTLQVQVTRCEIDDDTMIKEMSEEKILEELKKAINIWKKETPL